MDLSEEAIEKSVIDAAQRDEIVEALERGLRPRDAAAWAGVSVAQIKDELARDAAFAKRFHRARLGIKLKHLDNIHHIREGNGWRVSAWYLAGAYPKEFGRPRGSNPGDERESRAPRCSEKEAQVSFLNSRSNPYKNRQELERISDLLRPDDPLSDGEDVSRHLPPHVSLDRTSCETPRPSTTDEQITAAEPRPAAQPVDEPHACDDELHFGPQVPPPSDLPVLTYVDDEPVPPPNCLVVDGAIIEDGTKPGDETIFADYDQMLYESVADEIGAPDITVLMRYVVRRTGAYFDAAFDDLRLVGKNELMRRFGTLNVRRYVWTGVAYAQSFPTQEPKAGEEPP